MTYIYEKAIEIQNTIYNILIEILQSIKKIAHIIIETSLSKVLLPLIKVLLSLIYVGIVWVILPLIKFYYGTRLYFQSNQRTNEANDSEMYIKIINKIFDIGINPIDFAELTIIIFRLRQEKDLSDNNRATLKRVVGQIYTKIISFIFWIK